MNLLRLILHNCWPSTSTNQYLKPSARRMRVSPGAALMLNIKLFTKFVYDNYSLPHDFSRVEQEGIKAYLQDEHKVR